MNVHKKDLALYAVTDRSWLNGRTLYEQVQEALEGGVTCLQLREKNLPQKESLKEETLKEETLKEETLKEKILKEETLQEALKIKELCARYRVPFIINDDVSLAAKIDADGVHIGQKDMDVRTARALLGPDKIIGVSARTPEQALDAQAGGADYLGVGAVFATSTKQDAQPVSREQLRAVCTAVSIPAVAIGGITIDNMGSLSGTGISGIAVVSAVFAQPDIRTAAAALKERLRAVLE